MLNNKFRKPTLLSFINIIFGIVQSGFSLYFVFILIPRLTGLYEEFSVNDNMILSYIFPILMLIFGLLSIISGIKLYKSSENNFAQANKMAEIVLAISAVGFLLFIGLTVMSVLFPIYNLSSME